jgi:hypothetical protein
MSFDELDKLMKSKEPLPMDEIERDMAANPWPPSQASVDAHFEVSVTKNRFLLDHLPDGSM